MSTLWPRRYVHLVCDMLERAPKPSPELMTVSRPPDRSRDKPRRQNDRGDREAPRTGGPRTSSDRPGKPWREKRADGERKSGPDEHPKGPRSDAGRGPRRPGQKDRPEDRGPGRKDHGEQPSRDRRDARPERPSDGPRPARHQPWKRRPESEDEKRSQDRPTGDHRDRDHRGPRPERTSDAPRPERRQPWKRRPESEDENKSQDRKPQGERPDRDHRGPRPERTSDAPRPERRQAWKRRPEPTDEDQSQDRKPQGERPDRDHRGPRPERTSDAPRPDRRLHWKRHAEPEDEDRILIWGIHAVEAALRNPKREVKRLLLTDNASHRLGDALHVRPLTPEAVAPRDLDRELGNDTVHQGALLETSPLEEPSIDEILGASPNPLIVVLDQVTDPHNVGAILRSAAAFGVAAIIMTRRHSPPSSGALAKSASGALELVPVLHVPNLAQALAELGEKHVLRLGLDGDAPDALEDVVTSSAAPAGPIALVLGAEERGLRRLSKEHCDRLVCLTTPGALASLNVSNAAAISMHHIAIARREL